MSCKICGRNSCTESFHSIEEQQSFEEITNNVKERVRSKIYDAISRKVNGEWFQWNDAERYFVELDEVLRVINEVDL